jgi:hypothetical protein
LSGNNSSFFSQFLVIDIDGLYYSIDRLVFYKLNQFIQKR